LAANPVPEFETDKEIQITGHEEKHRVQRIIIICMAIVA
jgi:hypothetical protein